MHKLMGKLTLSLIFFCLATSNLYGQVTQLSMDISAFALESEDEELNNLIVQAIKGDEKAVATIENYVLQQELEPETRSKYIKALVIVARSGIPSAQEIFYQLVIAYGYEMSFHEATTEAFMSLLHIFQDIIMDRRSSDLLMLSTIKATNGVFYMSGRSEKAPLNVMYKSLRTFRDLLKNELLSEKYSDDLKMEVASALELLLQYDDLENFSDIRKVFIEILSDPRIFYLSRAKLFTCLATTAMLENSYGSQRSQMAFGLIEELIPAIEGILSDETNWSTEDLIASALRAIEVTALGNSKQAIELIERQIPQFKLLFMEERAKTFVKSIVSVLIAACINGNQQVAECLVSLISDDEYIDEVKEVSIGKLAAETRNGDSFAASTLRKAYAKMAGINDENHVPFSEFLWPNEKFPYWVLKELLTNRAANSLNPESLLEDTRPLMLMVFAKEGEPQISNAKKLLIPVSIEAGCRVLFYEISTDIELCEVAEDSTPLNIKADMALIMGHGSSKGGVQLGEPSTNCHELYRLDSSDMEEMRRFGSRLADEAVMVFYACLLGRGREDNKESIPNKFAEAAPHIGKIISADGIIYINPTFTVFEFDSESMLTNADFCFSNPHDDMYIIKLTELAVREIAGTNLTTIGEIKIRKKPSTPQTLLLQNYPNPFNPETWIPFHLGQESNVSIRIYNSAGRLMRSLALGYKPAGVYLGKTRAIYWDGKNESGETVTSGIYFCTMQAGDFSATKKLVMAR